MSLEASLDEGVAFVREMLGMRETLGKRRFPGSGSKRPLSKAATASALPGTVALGNLALPHNTDLHDD